MDARNRSGFELDEVQRGLEPESWKPFPFIGQGVREIRIQIGEQFRIIYVAKFEDKFNVLHVFQRKTQKTRSGDIEMTKNRLKTVIRRYQK